MIKDKNNNSVFLCFGNIDDRDDALKMLQQSAYMIYALYAISLLPSIFMGILKDLPASSLIIGLVYLVLIRAIQVKKEKILATALLWMWSFSILTATITSISFFVFKDYWMSIFASPEMASATYGVGFNIYLVIFKYLIKLSSFLCAIGLYRATRKLSGNK